MAIFPRMPCPSTSTSTSNNNAAAPQPSPSSTSATLDDEWDDEEARQLFSNLNIGDRMPEPQVQPSLAPGPNPSQPLSGSFLQVPPIVPSPNFPSSPAFPSLPNLPSPSTFSENGTFISSTSPGSQTAAPRGTFEEYFGPNPMAFTYNANSREDINSFNVTNIVTENSHNNNSVVTYSSSSQDGDELSHIHSTAESGHWDPLPPREPLPRAAHLGVNVNLDASFSHPFSSQQHHASVHTSLQASMEAHRRLLQQQHQQTMQNAAEARRRANEAAALAHQHAEMARAHAMHIAEQLRTDTAEVRRQADMARAEVHRQRDMARAHAEEVRFQEDMARAQAASLRQAGVEQRLADAERRRAEAEVRRQEAVVRGQEAEVRRQEAAVRRQEAEQRRQAIERPLGASFAAHSREDITVGYEPSTCPGYVHNEVSDGSQHGALQWISRCEHEACRMRDRNLELQAGGSSPPSQRVCMGYVLQEVRDEQGNPKWVSQLCGHEQCRILYNNSRPSSNI
ncbi:hypothetical protein M413DRAFT_447747 [Hebeloma cylindrosporum]|uniref:Uncharacterized protein n=1 Tax=Hebeloma cylindrosporum TaxID=76867 RepID=A0A0C2YBZ1_HEBCY|nr:hypothetical protein M413DRAFT_447747 [Hebeloma cylindrosporum h7]